MVKIEKIDSSYEEKKVKNVVFAAAPLKHNSGWAQSDVYQWPSC